MFGAIKQFVRLGHLFPRKPPFLCVPVTKLCTESQPTGPDVAALTNGDKDLEHRLKVLILEVDVMRQEGKLIPDESFMEEKHWQELLHLPSLSKRRKFLEFLFKLSKKREHQKEKKELKRLERASMKVEKVENETLEQFVSTYDLSHNNIFLRIYDTTINQMYNNRLVQAMKFGQKLIVDCGYDHEMTNQENKNCAKQLTLLFADNRSHDDPYDLHFCNTNPNSILMQTLNGFIGTLYEPWFPLHLHQSSYLENFPKEQLVYLTPHCREEMLEYDHDAIYIIGGIVDKVNTAPLSLAKAKREGIKMAKLPLDRYLQWGSGSGKSLTINQVVAILLDVKHTGDWKYALRHVPKRKLIDIAPRQLPDIVPQTTSQRKVWTPSKKIHLNNLTNKEKSKERMVKVRTIMND